MTGPMTSYHFRFVFSTLWYIMDLIVLMVLSATGACDLVMRCLIFSCWKYLSTTVPALQAPSLSDYMVLGFPPIFFIHSLMASKISGMVFVLIKTAAAYLVKISTMMRIPK